MENKGISKLDLKRRNRKQILLAIRRAGSLARVDIAAQLSLTRAAVTIITNQMISQGILEDLNSPAPAAADAPKRKGRRKTLIRINPEYRYLLGAIVNENDVNVGISNLGGEVLRRTSLQITDDTKQEEIIAFMVKSCRQLIKKCGITVKQVLGLGVGIVPSRWEQMCVEKEDGDINFEKLCYLLEMELSIPVAAASAIQLYAMANVDYSYTASDNQLLIYSGRSYHMAVISNLGMSENSEADTAMISRIVINPGGASCEGYPDGSVQAELTREALIAQMQAVGKDYTIEEMNAAYEAGDPDISKIIDAHLEKVSYLIYNLCIASCSRRVTLQNFMFIEKARKLLEEKLCKLEAKPNSIELNYSDIEGSMAFLAGCALIGEKQFYELGGLQPGENPA